ncbi:MAG: pyruvate carboxyltransferase [Deltaproteobacteria bacterium]|jgi:isopropylmalate/homocitrate/citramalate synthase|nr:pyruvate carboxyltransferase [Deltaproteobacteria bacterium]
MGFNEQGRWWVSEANYAPEVSGQFHFPEKIEILDTTLRDGEQQPGIILTRQEKVAIAKKLAAAGVQRIEAGTPAVSREDADAIKEISDLNLGPKIFCFVRNMTEDMKLARECGAYGVLAEIPGSEHLLKYGKKWTAEKAIKAAIEATNAAHDLGLYVTFFPADSSRASFNFLLDAVSQIAEAGHMDALALVDTFGCFSPEGAAFTVKRLKEHFSQPIEVHFHDDFGMGTASTMAGLAAGASVAHVTVNGIGERCGSVCLEQVALGLKVLYGQDCGIKLNKLKELSEFVAKCANFPVFPSKPVVGDSIFGWETGLPSSLWLNCKDTEPLAMLPYKWDLVGQREPVISLGKKSGKDNIRLWLKQGDFNLPEEKEGELLGLVKEKSIALKRVLTPEEFAALVAELA